MKRSLFCGIICAAVMPGTAYADSSISIMLSARVDPFCRISPPANSEIAVQDGNALIGQVREICNTPNGYNVTAHFTNISTGRLEFDSDSVMLQDGLATRTSFAPAVATKIWRLADAKLVTASSPVVMQVTIEPRG